MHFCKLSIFFTTIFQFRTSFLTIMTPSKISALFALTLIAAAVAFVAPISPQQHHWKKSILSRQNHDDFNRHDRSLLSPSYKTAGLKRGEDRFGKISMSQEVVGSQNELEIIAAEEVAEVAKQERLTSSYVVLAVLLFTFASNQWSRQALYYLCDFSANADPFKHINAGLGFDKEKYAALASFGFTVVFATFSLLAGGVSDKFDRNRVAASSCAVWSIATALQASATTFSELLPLRAVIGASQAFFNPAAYTLIAELFPKKMIGSINGIFSSGIYLGGGLASLSIILDGVVGWRQTLVVVGGIGLAAALMCLVLINDPRSFPETRAIAVAAEAKNPSEDKKSFDVSEVLTGLREVFQSRDAQLLFAASALRFCAGFSIAIWKAPFVFAKFPGSESAFAGSNAAVVACGGFLSSLVGGYLSDRLASPTDPTVQPRARCWVPAVGSILAAPLWAAFIWSKDPAVAALCLFGEYLTAECWFGPTLASLFQAVPRDRRGTAQGVFSVLTAAGNVAPVLVGALAGGQLGSFALGDVLIGFVSGAYILSGVLFGLVAVADDQRIAIEWKKTD